jgi:hypothetical protein
MMASSAQHRLVLINFPLLHAHLISLVSNETAQEGGGENQMMLLLESLQQVMIFLVAARAQQLTGVFVAFHFAWSFSILFLT